MIRVLGRADIGLACLDMAGTTVRDGGVVERAFTVAIAGAGLEPLEPGYQRALQIVRDTMGQSKIEVFRLILSGEDWSASDAERREAVAQQCNQAFEQAFAAEIESGAVTPLPGAEALFAQLRRDGVRICLTTGFARDTRDAILDHLGWHDLIDLALAPSDVARGRPYPDMILRACEQFALAPAHALVVGDTPSDMQAGRAAEAGLVVGVRSGAGDEASLRAAGADAVLAGIGELGITPPSAVSDAR